MLRKLFPLPTLQTALLHTLKVKVKGPHLTGPYMFSSKKSSPNQSLEIDGAFISLSPPLNGHLKQL